MVIFHSYVNVYHSEGTSYMTSPALWRHSLQWDGNPNASSMSPFGAAGNISESHVTKNKRFPEKRFGKCDDSIHAIVDLNGFSCGQMSFVRLAQSWLISKILWVKPVKRLMKCLIHWSLRISGTIVVIFCLPEHLKIRWPSETLWRDLEVSV